MNIITFILIRIERETDYFLSGRLYIYLYIQSLINTKDIHWNLKEFPLNVCEKPLSVSKMSSSTHVCATAKTDAQQKIYFTQKLSNYNFYINSPNFSVKVEWIKYILIPFFLLFLYWFYKAGNKFYSQAYSFQGFMHRSTIAESTFPGIFFLLSLWFM